LELWLEESSSDDEFVDSDTEDERRRADHQATDTDHWLIQKLIRYMKVSLVVHLYHFQHPFSVFLLIHDRCITKRDAAIGISK